MKRKRTDTVTIPYKLPDGVEREVVVEFNFYPGTPNVMYLPNGDPGDPGDPPELETLSATVDDEDVSNLLVDDDRFTYLVEQAVFEWYEDQQYEGSE